MLEPRTRRVRRTIAALVVVAVAWGTTPSVHARGAVAPTPEQTPPGTAPTQPPSGAAGEPLPPTDFDPPATEPAAPEPEAPAEPEPPKEPTPPKPTATAKPKPPPPKPLPDATDDTDDEEAPLPQRLPPMQTAGWWTLFGGFAIGTVAGVLAGLAEREEDRAVRLSVRYDLDTGEQPLYEEIRADYERTLRKGRAEANAAIALGVVGLGAAVAGLTVLLVAQSRDRRAKRAAPPATAKRVRVLGGGLQVRF